MAISKKTIAENIDEYIALQPEAVRPVLEQLRQTIRKAAPEAEEIISYQMPAYKQCGLLVFFAAYRNHYGFYPTPSVVKAFKEKLKPYKQGKASIQFSWDKPVPVKLITEMVQFRVKENTDKKKAKEQQSKKNK